MARAKIMRIRRGARRRASVTTAAAAQRDAQSQKSRCSARAQLAEVAQK
jgi:hypothetical protein